MSDDEIDERDQCLRRPRGGDGSAWCHLKRGHRGLHESEMGQFRAVEPVERRMGSRRLRPEVGKAGALPPAGRRTARDRRSTRTAMARTRLSPREEALVDRYAEITGRTRSDLFRSALRRAAIVDALTAYGVKFREKEGR